MVVIRLARYGKVNAPFYKITVAEQDFAAGGRFIEKIGHFDPKAKGAAAFRINKERYDYWIAKGAQATDRVKSLVSKSARG